MTVQVASSAQTDPDCPFCAIISDRENAKIIHRWKDCVAFVPLHPATLGHTLVVPNSHIETIWDIDEEVGTALTSRVLEMAVVLRDTLGLKNMNIIQSNGIEATQTVPHLHVHLVPRFKNDGMGKIWPEDGRREAEQATDVVVGNLRAAIKERRGRS